MAYGQGFVDLYNAISSINSAAIEYDKGPGIFDKATVDKQYYLHIPGVSQALRPSEYYVNKDLLRVECDVIGSTEGAKVYERNSFEPGTYLILYFGTIPVVLFELVTGDEAIG